MTTNAFLFSLPRRLIIFVVGLCALLSVSARTWQVDEVPIPYLEDARRYVSNPENILSPATVDSIDRLLFALEQDKGVQTVVMVLDKIEGGDAYDFAMRVARKYGVGSKEQRTGLVVLLAVGDRSYQFLTGNGLEGTLPDATIQRIEDRIFVPRLKAQDWDGAMLEAMRAIDGVCRGDESLVKGATKQEDGDNGAFLLFVLIAVGSFIAISVYAERVKKRPRPCPNCRRVELRWISTRAHHERKRGRRILVTETTSRCAACGHTEVERHEQDDDYHAGNAAVLGAVLGSMGGRRGGGFGGGSFGGGSFGGGGSGGSF